MVLLSVNSICVSFGTNIILDNVNFSINDNDKLGIVGINGAGKSTLAKLVSKDMVPTSGNIFLAKNKSIGYLAQNATIDSERTVFDEMLLAFPEAYTMDKRLEEIEKALFSSKSDTLISEYTSLTEKFAQIGGYEYKSRAKSTLERFGFDESFRDKKISTLSGGERTRLALVQVILSQPDLLILDEPTNHLDITTIEWLESHLSSYPNAIIVISHDRYFLDRVTNKTLELQNTHAHLYNGNYSFYENQKMEDEKALLKKYELQQKEISRIEAMIEQQRKWGQEHNFVTIKSKEKQIEHMELVSAPEKKAKEMSMKFSKATTSANDVLIAYMIGKKYGERTIFKDLSFTLKRNDRMLVIGPNGSGKSTLMKILGGIDDDYSGDVVLGHNVIPAYFSQELDNLDPSKSVIEEIVDAYPKLTTREIRAALARFLFGPEDIDKQISLLSGGEKARLSFCKMMLSKINFLILDEPTNNLDISSKEILEQALLNFEGTIVAVSHDRYFINKLATRIIEIDNEKYTLFNDNYSSYVDYKSKLSEKQVDSVQSIKQKTSNKEEFESNKKLLSDIRKNESKITRAEKEIDDLEKLKASLIEETEKNSDNYQKLTELYNKITETDERIEFLYNDIEEAENTLNELRGNCNEQ
ncbi:MAG: ATP-binding cassette domain-containing protein [Clostridiales bacterium]|nr:ATP-binding cassette domain-containing protein [Clostridiales bacterium]